MTPKTVLKSYFGYEDFRPGQENIIAATLSNRDVLAILPTGGGKSLCFQIPGLIFEGTTIVVSPLIALMEDQVLALRRRNIKAVLLSSSLKHELKLKTISKIKTGECKFVYVSPERLQSQEFLEVCQSLKIPLVVVDEAHCISQWGDSFRPEYFEIDKFIKKLNQIPTIIALTASATKNVESDIANKLNLRKNYFRFSSGIGRPNLKLQIIKCDSSLVEQLYLLRLLKKHQNQTGIIYTATRKSTKELAKILKNKYQVQVPIGSYHGGMRAEERSDIQQRFLQNKIRIIIATNAFGMGIDKPDIRFVIHYHYPASLEAYYQEVGRAGRDGMPADCYSFHEPTVQKIHLALIKNQTGISKNNKIRQLAKLEKFTSSKNCRMLNLQKYFDEKSEKHCGNCDNCLKTFQHKFWWQFFLDDKDEIVFLKKLYKFRDELCFNQKINPTQFLTNLQLCYFALIKPQSKADFSRIPGIGRGWLTKWHDTMHSL